MTMENGKNYNTNLNFITGSSLTRRAAPDNVTIMCSTEQRKLWMIQSSQDDSSILDDRYPRYCDDVELARVVDQKKGMSLRKYLNPDMYSNI